MTRENPKSARVKLALKEAIIELLKEKQPYDITVAELCRKAKVNRATFYNHYSIPTEIVDEIVNDFRQKMENCLAVPSDNPNMFNFKAFTLNYCEEVYKNREIYKVLCLSNTKITPEYLYAATKKTDAISNSRVDLEDAYRVHFISGGIKAFMLNWAKRDFCESPKDAAKMLYNIIIETVKPV